MRKTIVALLAGAGLVVASSAAWSCPAHKSHTAETPVPAAPITTAEAPAPVKN